MMAQKAHTSGYYRTRRHMTAAIAYILLLVFLGYFLLPLLWLVVSSTKTNAQLFSTFGFWFAETNHFVENLKTLFTYDNGSYGLWLRNTAVYATVVAVVSSLISAMAGYAFAQYRFGGRSALYILVMASIFVPATVFAVPLFLLMSRSGLSNSLLAIILPSLVNPFGVFLMTIYAEQAVSQDMVDAARVDGAGEFRIFFSIVFRLLAPAYVTVLLFAFVGAWNNYFLPLLLLSRQDLYLLTLGLAYWNGQATLPGGAHILHAIVITGSVVAIIPVMLLFLLLQRYWQRGLALGSVK